MKVKVNRLLSAGKYHVSFEVSDFTPEELAKMSSFGAPMIEMQWTNNNGVNISSVSINRITNNLVAVFPTQDQAEQYQAKVLGQIQKAILNLRERKDEFSKSDEVSF